MVEKKQQSGSISTHRSKPSSKDWEKHSALSQPAGYANLPKDFDWVEKNVPCQAACPAGTDVPGYLEEIARGNFDQAYVINLRDNVFPAVLGRVCTRPCEPACRHGWDGLGEPVAICFSKRSSASFMANKKPVQLDPIFKSSGKKIAVVGAGVAGLTAARELALWGHKVDVFERCSEPGGLMILGIPPFRLPRDIVQHEVEQIRLAGVQINCNVEIGKDVLLATLMEKNDAVILAAGTLSPYLPSLPGIDLRGVSHGLDFLMQVNQDQPVDLGKQVVVIGGGFTAVDCARTAKRLGAQSVYMAYRRSEAQMYITGNEVQELKHEGIVFQTQVAPIAFLGEHDQLKSVRFIKTQIGEPDASGRADAISIEGTEFEVDADSVLLGTGQVQDLSWLDESTRNFIVEQDSHAKLQTEHSKEKIFLAGDFSSGANSLIDAIGHAKQVSRDVDLFLMNEDRWADCIRIETVEETGRSVDMDSIPRQLMPFLELGNRSLKKEVDLGYASSTSKVESSRCYLCNYKFEIDNELCIYCDRCLKVKPVENCIEKISSLIYDHEEKISGYHPSKSSKDYNLLYIDQNECIRCGACVEVCPVECISLQKVTKDALPHHELNKLLSSP